MSLYCTSPDILPCRGRREPAGCYTIEFTFPDFYENVEPNKADIDQLTEEPKSVNVNREAKPKLKEFKTTTFDYPLTNLVYFGIGVLGVALLIAHF